MDIITVVDSIEDMVDEISINLLSLDGIVGATAVLDTLDETLISSGILDETRLVGLGKLVMITVFDAIEDIIDKTPFVLFI